jgi:pimeloyl-ACP methyl ester carboxylesterase
MPLLFGDGAAPRYGVYHAAAGRAPKCAVVLANPFGHEAMRAHRAFRQLATQLARDGWPTLRFDYLGTGDSAGEDPPANLDALAQDVAAAADEVRDLASVRHVVLCGLRLGAEAALAAAAGRRDVRGVVAWDPIPDGAAFVRTLAVTERAAGMAVGGFACAPTFLESVRSVGHAETHAAPKRLTVVATAHAASALAPRRAAWERAGATVTHVATNTSPAWDAVDADGSIVLPAEALQLVADAVAALGAGPVV